MLRSLLCILSLILLCACAPAPAELQTLRFWVMGREGEVVAKLLAMPSRSSDSRVASASSRR